MRVPRQLSGDDLIKALRRFGYQITRQTGSHVRLTRNCEGREFHLTIPKHNPLRIGTLNNILRDLSKHLELEKEALIEKLF
jgi:predicted RNA binding protein YcfA (HicA-like mRNA interferase family)